MELKRYQKINHFPGMNEICRKDLLARNLNRMLKLYPKEYNIFPKTWCLPSEYHNFVAYSRARKNKTFICKPDSECQGRGIFLTRNTSDVKPGEDMICQVYIPKPFILDGFKFDLRLYVLITSCDPLRIYFYDEGLIRFATMKYSEPTENNLEDVCMHLTNYSINKLSKNFVQDETKGSKRSVIVTNQSPSQDGSQPTRSQATGQLAVEVNNKLRKLSFFNQYMDNNAYDLERLWSSIEDVIIKTILVAYPVLKHNYLTCFPNHASGSACFEILGFDILLDQTLKPWLLEVNHSPSFTTDSKLDQEVKDNLLNDTLCMINLAACDRRKVMEQERRRTSERLLHIYRPREDRADEIRSNQTARVEQMEKYEDENIGNFRRIYPIATSEKYDKFLKCKYSLFQETIASKAREECARQMRQEIQQRQEQKELLPKGRKCLEKNLRGEYHIQKNPSPSVLVKPKSAEELQTPPSSTPTSQVSETASSRSQQASEVEKENADSSIEQPPSSTDVVAQLVIAQASEPNAVHSECSSLTQSQSQMEPKEVDQKQGQLEGPSEVSAAQPQANAKTKPVPLSEAQVQRPQVQAESEDRVVQEELQSQASSEISTQILLEAVDKVHQEAPDQFPPETYVHSQTNVCIQAKDQTQPAVQGEGQSPAQGQIQKEDLGQPLEEVQDQPEPETYNQTQARTHDQAQAEACDQIQAEAQNQVQDDAKNQDEKFQEHGYSNICDLVPQEAGDQSQPQSLYLPLSEAQNKGQLQAWDKVQLQVQDEIYHETQVQVYHETQDQVYHKAQVQVYHESQNQVYHETQAQVYHETQDQVYHEAQVQVCHETQDQVYNEAQDQVYHETQVQVYHETQEQVNHEKQDQVYHETQAQVYHEAQAQVYHETQVQVYNEAQDQVYHEAQDQVYHEAQDQVYHEAHDQVYHEAKYLEQHEVQNLSRHKAQSPERHEAQSPERLEAQTPEQHEAQDMVQLETQDESQKEAHIGPGLPKLAWPESACKAHIGSQAQGGKPLDTLSEDQLNTKAQSRIEMQAQPEGQSHPEALAHQGAELEIQELEEGQFLPSNKCPVEIRVKPWKLVHSASISCEENVTCSEISKEFNRQSVIREEEIKAEDMCSIMSVKSTDQNGSSSHFHFEVQRHLKNPSVTNIMYQNHPEAQTLLQGGQNVTKEMQSTAGHQHFISQMVKKVSMALKRNHNQVCPSNDINYFARRDVTENPNTTEEISNPAGDQCDSSCSCWRRNNKQPTMSMSCSKMTSANSKLSDTSAVH